MITRRVYFTLKYHTSFKVLLFLPSHRDVRVHYRDMARPAFPKVSRLIYRGDASSCLRGIRQCPIHRTPSVFTCNTRVFWRRRKGGEGRAEEN